MRKLCENFVSVSSLLWSQNKVRNSLFLDIEITPKLFIKKSSTNCIILKLTFTFRLNFEIVESLKKIVHIQKLSQKTFWQVRRIFYRWLPFDTLTLAILFKEFYVQERTPNLSLEVVSCLFLLWNVFFCILW